MSSSLKKVLNTKGLSGRVLDYVSSGEDLVNLACLNWSWFVLVVPRIWGAYLVSFDQVLLTSVNLPDRWQLYLRNIKALEIELQDVDEAVSAIKQMKGMLQLERVLLNSEGLLVGPKWVDCARIDGIPTNFVIEQQGDMVKDLSQALNQSLPSSVKELDVYGLLSIVISASIQRHDLELVVEHTHPDGYGCMSFYWAVEAIKLCTYSAIQVNCECTCAEGSHIAVDLYETALVEVARSNTIIECDISTIHELEVKPISVTEFRRLIGDNSNTTLQNLCVSGLPDNLNFLLMFSNLKTLQLADCVNARFAASKGNLSPPLINLTELSIIYHRGLLTLLINSLSWAAPNLKSLTMNLEGEVLLKSMFTEIAVNLPNITELWIDIVYAGVKPQLDFAALCELGPCQKLEEISITQMDIEDDSSSHSSNDTITEGMVRVGLSNHLIKITDDIPEHLNHRVLFPQLKRLLPHETFRVGGQLHHFPNLPESD